MKELKRYFSYMGDYRVAYWSVFIMTLITSVLLNLTYPYMNKLIFNAVEYKDGVLFQKAAAICIILVALNCLAPYRRYFQIRIVRKIVFDIKIRLFEKLMKMDMNYYTKHHSAEALKTLNWDANSLKDSYFSHVFWVAGRFINGLTSLIAMFIYSPVLMMVSVCFCLITVYLSVKINKQIKEEDKKIQSKTSQLINRLSDILTGFAELKMYSGASVVYDDFYGKNEKVLGEEEKRAEKAAGLEMTAFLLGILASFGTTFVGAYLVSCGRLDYGTVMAVVSLQMGVSTLMQGFGSALATLSASLVKAGRVFDFLESEGEEEQDEEPKDETIAEVRKGTIPIEIENLTFCYDGQREILKEFSMSLAEDEKVLLMGESGCGKSTLLKLLMGFYRKKDGAIRLYGREISEYSLFQLRQLVTYMSQRSYLFEGTVRENIAIGSIGKESITEEEILRAAKMAYADEFIRQLPQGYDTYLSAGGNNLSVGQRQRIALARAFLKTSPILLMDEPSAALDVHSEKMIQRGMKELMRDKTVIMVTHREWALEEFDRVVRL